MFFLSEKMNIAEMDKRSALVTAVTAVSAVGLLLLIIPFVSSMFPTPRAGHVAVKNIAIDDLEPGQFIQIEVQQRPVVIFRPNQSKITDLAAINDAVWEPPINSEEHASMYVYLGISTTSGCAVMHAEKGSFGEDWLGGWMDPCTMGAWDYAGRAFKSVNVANGVKINNLAIPNYRLLNDTEIQFYK